MQYKKYEINIETINGLFCFASFHTEAYLRILNSQRSNYSCLIKAVLPLYKKLIDSAEKNEITQEIKVWVVIFSAKTLDLKIFFSPSKLQETYQCIYENLQDCDMPVESHLLSEVKAIQSMLGNLTCPLMSWCNNTWNQSAVVEQMCASPVPCSLDWSSCVAYTGYAYCL